MFINRNHTFASCFELSVVSETQENQRAILNASYSGFCHLLFRRWLHQYNFSACTSTSSFLCWLFFYSCYYYAPIPLSINYTWYELHPSQIPALREQYIKLIVSLIWLFVLAGDDASAPSSPATARNDCSITPLTPSPSPVTSHTHTHTWIH